MGACFGTAVSAVWAVLDWRSVLYTEWTWMGACVICIALVGMVTGFAVPVRRKDLAASVDRRGDLQDRLTTAIERDSSQDTFDAALQEDAARSLDRLVPREVFPIRFGRWHLATLILALMAASVFLLGNSPVVLSEENRRLREELKKQGQAVERVTKQQFETPDAKREMSAEEKRLADEMRKYYRDLEKAHLSQEEAMQRSNELGEKADQLAKQAAQAVQQSLQQAQSARASMEKATLDANGLGNVSPQMAGMPESEREEKMAQAKAEARSIQKQLGELKRRLDEINKKLANPNLSGSERKKLEDERRDVEKQIADLKERAKANLDEQKALELSKAAQEVFRKMMEDPLYKKLLEIEKKLAQDAKSAAKSGQPKMTDEERKRLKEELEQLAQQLKDPKAMKEYLEALLKAAEEAKRMGRGVGIGLTLNHLGFMQAPPGPGGPGGGNWVGNVGQVYKLDKPTESKGKTSTSVVSGEVRQGSGPQAFVEIKAPSFVGSRSGIPYQNVLPSYERKAESALERQQIPKEHQKRVKEYFDSLTGVKKE
ncbi:MAG: hypothetical protein P4L46_15660 [Fimbriimonas sp.]|nr:hypothetical protein [Fimbriimonas sp.]